jgi:hypothetical protein
MALIFHQNMRDYGGNSAPRNVLYATRLGLINAATGSSYIVAGFTEVMNSGVGLRTNLSLLAQQLDAGLTALYVFGVGATSVGARREYIGIAVDPAYVAVTHVGSVLRNVYNQWQVFAGPVGALPAGNVMAMPVGAPLQADSRGLAFVAAVYNGVNYIFGFMHNMYAIGEKTGAYQNLGLMASRIRTALTGAGYGAARVIFGGDFNLDPGWPGHERNPSRRPLTMHRTCMVGAFGQPIRTTAVNTYDFWVVTHAGTTDANCNVYNQTFVVPLGSDHCGVTVRI